MNIFYDIGSRLQAYKDIKKCLLGGYTPCCVTGVSNIHKAQLAMTTSTLSTSYTAAGQVLTAAEVVGAEGALGGEASNPVLITTRAAAADMKAAALSAGYGYDPFDGMDIIFCDSVALGGKLGIVADLSGVQANFPNGDEVKFVFDEYTEAPADIVRVIGRMMYAVGVVSKGKVVYIVGNNQ